MKDVQVQRRTGSAILDSAAITAFKQWRFRPGALFERLNVDLPKRSVIPAEDYLGQHAGGFRYAQEILTGRW